ncbi:MAG: LAGLIDADG family homing endonuclease [Actinobacteria bacterium]|nr:LAGLIDADG family homing endonuclease [Actinomycetota bacterium]
MDPSVLVSVLQAEARASPASVLAHYLAGATRDASFSTAHNTTRFHQKGKGWLTVLETALAALGQRSWMYEEGRRGVFVLETCWRPDPVPPRTPEERAAFCRGYFDADGGMPQSLADRLYFQFVQKNRQDLQSLRGQLAALDIECGRLHVPSKRVDPDYWRVFVRARSFEDFMLVVGSWHPRKWALISARLGRGQDDAGESPEGDESQGNDRDDQ